MGRENRPPDKQAVAWVPGWALDQGLDSLGSGKLEAGFLGLRPLRTGKHAPGRGKKGDYRKSFRLGTNAPALS